jgi:hypothetical protein
LGSTGFRLLLAGFVLALAIFLVVVLTARLGQEFIDFASGQFHGDRRE